MRVLVLLALLLTGPAHADPRWPDFRVIMWSDHTAAEYATLAKLGINSAKVPGQRTPEISPDQVTKSTAEVRAAGFPYYVENLATDFYAPYHRWTPEHPGQVTWLMDELRKRYFANQADPAVWERTPSLSDEAWIDRIRTRLATTVRLHMPNHPLFYNLGDETGIADLTSAWDFDYSAPSLAAFRAWLHTHYASLGALNAQWDSNFASWDAVIPEHTTAALQRKDGNFSSWSDFNDFMDHAFAEALRAGTDAIHAADPSALAAIEGAQTPGRGGYDYTRLPKAVDVMELWATAGNLQIARTINPGIIPLTTVFGTGPAEASNIWRLALIGLNGLVIWDDPPMLDKEGKPTDRARSLASTLTALTEGVGAQLMASTPRVDPVAILYSPASQRLQWLLDRRGGGGSWAARTAEVEGGNDDAMRRTTNKAIDQLQHLGVQPQMLTPAMLEEGALDRLGIRLLILPRAIAMSSGEAQAVRRFLIAGGKIVSDGPAGIFDAHGRALRGGQLPSFPAPPDQTFQMAELLAQAHIQPILRVTNQDASPASGVQVYTLRNGAATLVGVQADFVAGAGPRTVVLNLPAPRAIQNIRGGGATVTDKLPITLDPVVPALLVISDIPVPKPVLGVVSAGRSTRLVLSLGGPTPATAQIEQLELIRPDGVVGSTIRVPLSVGMITPVLNFGPEDPGGSWLIRAKDMLGSGQAEVRVNVPPP